MNLEIEAARLFARVIAEDCGVSLKIDENCEVPCTSGKTITMPMLRPEWEVDSPTSLKWWAGLIHECYHHKGTNHLDFKVLADLKIDTSKFYGMVLNIVVDHNIEHKEYGKLSGADEWMDAFYSTSYAKIKSNLHKYPEETKKECALKAIVAFDHAMRTTWSDIPNLYLEEEFSSTMAKEMFTKLCNEATEVYLPKRDGGLPNIDVTNALMEILGLDDEKDGKKSQPDKGGDSSGDKKDSSGDSGNEGDSSGADGDDGDPTEGKVEDTIKLFYDDSGRVKDEPRRGGSNVKLSYDWDKTDCSGYLMVPAKEIPPKHLVGKGRTLYGVDDTLFKLTFTLSDKVKNILKVMSQVKWHGGYKRGKLHKKAIAKVATGSDVIFRQKEQKIVLDTAITVLLDSSGSMHSRAKYQHGMLACCMLSDAMNKVGIPIEILGFSQTFSGTITNEHYIHSTFGKRDNSRDIIESMDCVNLENNDDGAAIMWAHSRLMKQKAKRKILIVLSDGSPACSQAGAMPFTKKVVKEIEEKSPVEIYGIGILDNNVSRIYKEYSVIKSAEQLETALLSVVKSKIIN